MSDKTTFGKNPSIIRIAGTLISKGQLLSIFNHLSYTGKQALIELTEQADNKEEVLQEMNKRIEKIQKAAKAKQKEGIFNNEQE